MITMAERVRDVLARPEAYEGAFPVAEVPSDRYVYPTEFFGGPGEGLSREAYDAVRYAIASTPINLNSVAQRVLDGTPAVNTLTAPFAVDSLLNGEPTGNEVCTRCGRPRLCVQRRRSELGMAQLRYPLGVNPDPYVAVCLECLSPNATATGAQVAAEQRRAQHIAERNAYGQALRGYRIPVWQARPTRFVMDDSLPPDGPVYDIEVDAPPIRFSDHNPPRLSQLLWGSDGDLRTHEARQVPERPDHYRVRDGECACGFRSIFRDDMDGHIGEGSNVRG